MIDSQARTIIEDLLRVAELHPCTVPTQFDAVRNARAYLAGDPPPPDTTPEWLRWRRAAATAFVLGETDAE